MALVGVLITQIVTTNNARESLTAQQELQEERARETELQTYFDDIGGMLLDEDSPLPEAESGDPVGSLARAKTISVLERLDGQRKKIILQFLYESQLIEKEEPIVSLAVANLDDAALKEANLTEAYLSSTYLRGADLSNAYLAGANMRGAYLTGANLHGAKMSTTDLSEADLRNSDLSNTYLRFANLSDGDSDDDLRGAMLTGADLSGANVTGADLSGVDLTDANLSGTEGIYVEQLEEKARSLEGATMPDGSKHD